MKYIAKSLVVASALIGASTASATGCFDFGCMSPYFGAEYEWTRSNTHHRNDFRRGGLAKTYNGGNIFLGARWCDFALEGGYDFTGKKSRRFANIPFISRTTGLPSTLTARVHNRFEGWHLDANGYMPVCDCLELIGSLGFGWTRAKFGSEFVIVDANGARARHTSNHSGYKGVFRIGAGAQYMVTECVGLRTMVRYKTGNHNHTHNARNFALRATNRAKDAVSLSAGAFVKF